MKKSLKNILAKEIIVFSVTLGLLLLCWIAYTSIKIIRTKNLKKYESIIESKESELNKIKRIHHNDSLSKAYVLDLYNELNQDKWLDLGLFQPFETEKITADSLFRRSVWEKIGEESLGSYDDFDWLIMQHKRNPMTVEHIIQFNELEDSITELRQNSENISDWYSLRTIFLYLVTIILIILYSFRLLIVGIIWSKKTLRN